VDVDRGRLVLKIWIFMANTSRNRKDFANKTVKRLYNWLGVE